LDAAARPVFNVVIDIRLPIFRHPRDFGARSNWPGSINATFWFCAASQTASPVLLNTTSRTLASTISKWQIITHIVG
jgi:hypothetical protein